MNVNAQIKIRVIVSYYNGSMFFEEQLESLVKQSIEKNWIYEIWIYDDFSTKDEYKKLLNIVDNTKTQVDIVVKRLAYNHGLVALNFTGLEEATSSSVDYIFLSDQDDVWELTKIKKQIYIILEDNSIACYHRELRWFYKSKKFVENKALKVIGANTMCINLKEFNTLTKINYASFLLLLNDLKFRKLSDSRFHDGLLDFIFKFFKAKITYMNEFLVWHRVHDDSLTNSENSLNLIKIRQYQLYSKYFKKTFLLALNKKLSIFSYSKIIMDGTRPFFGFAVPYLICVGTIKFSFLFNLPFCIYNFFLYVKYKFRKLNN